ADPRPGRSAVVALEQPSVAGGQKPARLPREHRQRLDAAVQRKWLAMPQPRLARIRAVPHTPARCPEVDAVVHRLSSRPSGFPRQQQYTRAAPGAIPSRCPPVRSRAPTTPLTVSTTPISSPTVPTLRPSLLKRSRGPREAAALDQPAAVMARGRRASSGKE